jgi:hypothetical protein
MKWVRQRACALFSRQLPVDVASLAGVVFTVGDEGSGNAHGASAALLRLLLQL